MIKDFSENQMFAFLLFVFGFCLAVFLCASVYVAYHSEWYYSAVALPLLLGFLAFRSMGEK